MNSAAASGNHGIVSKPATEHLSAVTRLSVPIDDGDPIASSSELPRLTSLDDVVQLLNREAQVFVRWSTGPDDDANHRSCDELTGVELPGLSANHLAVANWWADRPLELWVARRLYDYRHLRDQRGPGVRPWVLEGREIARGPDNEPLVVDVRAIAWLDEKLIAAATTLVDEQKGQWGPLHRS